MQIFSLPLNMIDLTSALPCFLQSLPIARGIHWIFSLLILVICVPMDSYAQFSGDTFRGVRVESEDRCSRYSGRDYSYPQSVEPKIIERQEGLFSPYDMRCFVSRRQTQIEHIVARSEAHDSGMCNATLAERRAFSEDLLNLTLATPVLNGQEKAAYDAADWVPTYNRCWYAHTIVEVKRKYNLTIDRKEADALDKILRDCPEVEMVRPTCADGDSIVSIEND